MNDIIFSIKYVNILFDEIYVLKKKQNVIQLGNAALPGPRANGAPGVVPLTQDMRLNENPSWRWSRYKLVSRQLET